MTALSSSTSSQTSPQWEAVGAWEGGTAVAVALSETAHGLLASPAGVYGWTQPGGVVESLAAGLNDLNVVAVAFAGGNAEQSPLALAATATGRLFQRAADASTSDAWQEISAWAGLGVAVVIAPSPAYADDRTLFVGTPTGIFRTQDGGQHWESCNFGLLDEEALCMACAPNFAESEVLWAGTAGGGLYRSRNSARAWRESGMGLPDAALQSLAVSPNFAADRTLFVGMEGHGVYVSRDGGENWASFALTDQSANALACVRAGVLWVGTDDGLWRVDVGTGDAVQVTAVADTVMSLAVNGQGQMAVGLYGGGLWLTDDCDGDPQAMIWQQPEVALHAPPVVAQVGDAIYALDGDGLIAQSEDGGAQWAAMASESPEIVFALDGARVAAADGSQSSMIYAATASGLAVWDAATEAWQAVGQVPLSGDAVFSVDLSPTFGEDQTLLVTGPASELLISQDGGTSWQTSTAPWAGQSLLHAHFAPDSVNELVAITVQPTESGHFALTVWNSTDLGQQWEVLAGLTSGVPAVVVAWPHDDTEHAIFLATQHRVIKLFHAGEPPTLQVHQHFFDEALRVTALALAPDYVHSQIIWAATNDGLYRSVDRGMSWALVLDLPQALPVVWLDVTFDHINAITLGGRVWRAAL